MEFTACRKIMHCISDIAVESGIHGLRKAFNSRLHPLERIFWLITVIMALFGAGYITWVQFKRYDGTPMVMSLERDYRDWGAALPAVTLCYKNRLNATLANEFILRKWNVSETDEDYHHILRFMDAVLSASVDNFKDLSQFSSDERLSEVDLLQIFHVVKNSPQEILLFDDDITMNVELLMTEMGMCYVINSVLPSKTNESEASGNKLKEPINCYYGKRQCFVELHLSSVDAVATLHSPYEPYSIELEVIDMSKSTEIYALYKVVETVASSPLRDLSIEQRNCLFPDEEYLKMPVFSKAACLMNCRIEAALSLCNCVPFFYPFSEGPFCTTRGMACLQDFSWPVWSLNVCECPQTCISSEYSLNKIIDRKWANSGGNTKTGIFHTKSLLRFEVIPPKTRIRRTVLFTFEDFLVSFGGAVALFLGFSIWSMSKVPYVILKHIWSEIVYYLSKKQRAVDRKTPTKRI